MKKKFTKEETFTGYLTQFFCGKNKANEEDEDKQPENGI